MNRLLKSTIVVFLVLFVAAAAFGAGVGVGWTMPGRPFAGGPAGASSGDAERDKAFAVFWEAWDAVDRDFIDRKALDATKMTRGAITGMLESLGDRHTVYIDPESYGFEKSGIQGSFYGIGAEVTVENGQVTIVAPMADSPAEKAGLRAGDKIVGVDGEDATGWSLTQAVTRIRGAKGTLVRLTIRRPGQNEPFDVEVARGEIKTDSVRAAMLPDDGLAYVRIAQFAERTDQELVAKLKEVQKAGPKGLILDLRSNPGGLLDTTVSVASEFLSKGVVLYQLDSKGERKPYPVRAGGVATEIPMVVLVDKGSASGSEVLAGALQDAGRAVLIGEETYGKGSVTHLHEFSDGSAAAVTFARWLTPNGNLIEGKGLNPDIEVKLTEEDIQGGNDRQLQRAIQYLKTGS